MRSLELAGFDPSNLPSGVLMAETAGRLFGPPPEVVLFQNAWTMLPQPEVNVLLESYGPAYRAKQIARRWLAGHNARTARSTLTLTNYMATLVSNAGYRRPTAIPVGSSIDLVHLDATPPSALRHATRFALVPGSVQPYKSPNDALTFLERNRVWLPTVEHIVFAGPVVDRKLAHRLTIRASAMGIEPIFIQLARDEMKWALQNTNVTILSSSLESLGISLGEALYFSSLVAASPVPAHVEVSHQLRARPIFFGSDDRISLAPQLPIEALTAGWHQLSRALSRAG